MTTLTPPAAPKVLLTVEEAADRLNIGRTTLYGLIRKKLITSVRVGRLRRFRPTDLEEYAARLTATEAA